MNCQHRVDEEESWCTDDSRVQAEKVIFNSRNKHTSVQSQKTEERVTNIMRDYLYGERREPTEDFSGRINEPDEIETHRIVMENREVTPLEVVAQSGKRTKNVIINLADHTLNESEIVKRYLNPGTEASNGAMLFLAGTLFSSNQYVFEFLKASGSVRPSSQNVVNQLTGDFIGQGQELCNALVNAERSTGEAIKNIMISCVHNFVETSNKLVKVLKQDIALKSAAIGNARDNAFNKIIATRNHISESLYMLFKKIVEVNESSGIKKTSRERGGPTARFLADAEEFTNFLYSGLETDAALTNSAKLEPMPLAGRNTHVKAPKDIKKTQATGQKTKFEPHKQCQFLPEERDSMNDANDAISTTSSFLDFINGPNLSLMFNEDEGDDLEPILPEDHLDAIFERMNISISNEKVQNAEQGKNKSKKPTRHKAREKRRLHLLARNQARQERKQKRLEKKNRWSKMSIIGRKSNRKSGPVEF